MKTQLICTSTTRKDYNSVLDTIIDNYTLVNNKVFVLSTDTPYETICSYAIELSPNTAFLPNSISVHRKRDTNTMYTINALNTIIVNENNGVLDKRFQVDWSRYRNSLLTTNSDKTLKIIPTKLFIVERIR